MQTSLSIDDQISPELVRKARWLPGPGRRAVHEAMGLQLVSMTARSFNEASVRAAAWAALKPRTLAAKTAAGLSTAILKRTTTLSRSWRVSKVTSESVQVGSDRDYALYHQFGTRRLPARPMLPIIGTFEAPQFSAAASKKLASIAEAKLKRLLGAT